MLTFFIEQKERCLRPCPSLPPQCQPLSFSSSPSPPPRASPPGVNTIVVAPRLWAAYAAAASRLAAARANPPAAVPLATPGAVPAGATITEVSPGTAPPAYCERGLRHSLTARRMWLSMDANVILEGRGCNRCQTANRPCVMTGAVQCAFCTASGYGSTRLCSLAGSGLNVRAFVQVNTQ